MMKTAFVSLKSYRQKSPLLLASSTAFFTLFALPPILIIVSSVFGAFINQEILSDELFEALTSILGSNSTMAVKTIFHNFKSMVRSPVTTVFGFLFFAFAATTLVDIVKRSINYLWDIKIIDKRSIFRHLFDRFVSLCLIGLAGLFFLVSLIADALLNVLNLYFHTFSLPMGSLRLINAIFSILITGVWFTLIFKWLPNARINFIPAITGGLFTALLFEFGKYILGRILIHGNIGLLFGLSGSLVLLLLFVFYSALIFYYGALFTAQYAEAIHAPLRPGSHSAVIEEVIVEKAD